jgi:hypothetical protein
MLIRGRCHCGNIAFALDWRPDPAQIPARACGCSFCTAHGGVWTASPQARLHVDIADRALVSEYEFGTRTAQFRVCTRCGVVPLVTSRIAARLYAVVNVNTFENVDPASLRRSAASFDGESEDARLARRQRFWIGNVSVVDRT